MVASNAISRETTFLAAIHRERLERMARKAAPYFELEPEESGSTIVRRPFVPGRIEIVDRNGQCSCPRYRVWGRCKHAALVLVATSEKRQQQRGSALVLPSLSLAPFPQGATL
jgi:hypothetical protein